MDQLNTYYSSAIHYIAMKLIMRGRRCCQKYNNWNKVNLSQSGCHGLSSSSLCMYSAIHQILNAVFFQHLQKTNLMFFFLSRLLSKQSIRLCFYYAISVYHSWLMRSKMIIQEYKESNLESIQERSQIQALDGITLIVLIAISTASFIFKTKE